MSGRASPAAPPTPPGTTWRGRAAGVAIGLFFLGGLGMCVEVVERRALDRIAEKAADDAELIAMAINAPGVFDLIAAAYVAADHAAVAVDAAGAAAAGVDLGVIMGADYRRGLRDAADAGGMIFDRVEALDRRERSTAWMQVNYTEPAEDLGAHQFLRQLLKHVRPS